MLAQRHSLMSDTFDKMVLRLETHATTPPRRGMSRSLPTRRESRHGTEHCPTVASGFLSGSPFREYSSTGQASLLTTRYTLPAATPFPPLLACDSLSVMETPSRAESSLQCRVFPYQNLHRGITDHRWLSGVECDTCPFAWKCNSASEYFF